MPAGRPAKPTALKRAEGNPGRRNLDTGEPQPFGEMPERPDWLTGTGAEVWNLNADKLNRIGLLTEIDGLAFAMLCDNAGQWIDLATDSDDCVRMSENGGEYLAAAFNARSSLHKSSLALLREFGMTPSSRARIQLDIPKQDEVDPFDEAMSGKVTQFPKQAS